MNGGRCQYDMKRQDFCKMSLWTALIHTVSKDELVDAVFVV